MWPSPNCSSTSGRTPRLASAHAAAEPSRPAPATTTSARSTGATIAGRTGSARAGGEPHAAGRQPRKFLPAGTTGAGSGES